MFRKNSHPATFYGIFSGLSFLLAVITIGSFEDPTFAQITPTDNHAYDLTGQNANKNSTPGSNQLNDNQPLTPSGPPSPNSGEENPIHQKYIAKTDGIASKEKTLVEKIFSKVNEDLKASGLEPIN